MPISDDDTILFSVAHFTSTANSQIHLHKSSFIEFVDTFELDDLEKIEPFRELPEGAICCRMTRTVKICADFYFSTGKLIPQFHSIILDGIKWNELNWIFFFPK